MQIPFILLKPSIALILIRNAGYFLVLPQEFGPVGSVKIVGHMHQLSNLNFSLLWKATPGPIP